MIKFNDSNIFVGYIKQLLSSFNLPKYRVYTRDNERYFEENNKESQEILSSNVTPRLANKYIVNYIKDDMISYYDKLGWHNTGKDFIYGKKDYNSTRKLSLSDGNVYNSDTHEYLGDYLRFQRDYLGLDLMPLYNCFSNRQANQLYKAEDRTVLVKDSASSNTTSYKFNYFNYNINFDSSDTNYKIYMLPVKLFRQYTIAIESEKPVEMFCALYDSYFNNRQYQDLIPLTYQKFNSLSFSKPVVYDKLTAGYLFEDTRNINVNNHTNTAYTIKDFVKDNINLSRLSLQERNLKLFIKLPADIETSIVILEGNYLGYNNGGVKKLSYINKKLWQESSNRTVINYETEKEAEEFATDQNGNIQYKKEYNPATSEAEYVPIIKPNVILKHNPEVYDRNINYITDLQLLDFNTKISYPFADRLIEYLIENTIDVREDLPDNMKRVETVMSMNGIDFNTTGVWNDKIRPYIYDYMNDYQTKGVGDNNHDILGYIDKDTEKYYASWKYDYLYNHNGMKIPLTDEKGQILWQYWQDVLGTSNDEAGNIENEENAYDATMPATAYNQVFWAQSTEIITDENGNMKPLGYRMKKTPKATLMNVDIYKKED